MLVTVTTIFLGDGIAEQTNADNSYNHLLGGEILAKAHFTAFTFKMLNLSPMFSWNLYQQKEILCSGRA